MKRLFGKAKEQPAATPATSLSEASARAGSRADELQAKINACEQDIKRHMEKGPAAKQLALQCMKRKKMYEQQRDQLIGTQFNVECLAGAQEQAELTAMTVAAMQHGHNQLKQQQSRLGGVTDIEKLMDDMADLNAEMADVNEALSSSYAVPDGFNDADCEAEFAALEEQIAAEKLDGRYVSDARPDYLPAAQQPASASTAGAAEAAAAASAPAPAALETSRP